jgi:hypothetical protein
MSAATDLKCADCGRVDSEWVSWSEAEGRNLCWDCYQKPVSEPQKPVPPLPRDKGTKGTEGNKGTKTTASLRENAPRVTTLREADAPETAALTFMKRTSG